MDKNSKKQVKSPLDLKKQVESSLGFDSPLQIRNHNRGIYGKKRDEESSEEEEASDDSQNEEEEEREHDEDEQDVENAIDSETIDNETIDIEVDDKRSVPLSKIEKGLVIDDISPSVKEHIDVVLNMFEGTSARVVVAPNWSEVTQFYPPSGFTLMLNNRTTPVEPSIFHPSKLYYGTSAIKLSDAKFKNGDPVTLNNIIKNEDKIVAQLNTKLVGQNARLIKNHEDMKKRHQTNVEKESIDSELQNSLSRFQLETQFQEDAGSFASLAFSNEIVDNKRKIEPWLIVRNGDMRHSQEIRNIVQQVENVNAGKNVIKKPTYKSLFLDEKSPIYKLKSEIASNRNRIMYDIIENCLGIDLPQNKLIARTVDSELKGYVVKPDVETITNRILSPRNNDLIVYTSGTTVAETINGGLILNVNPFVGSTILKGPYSSPECPYGKKWTIDLSPEDDIKQFAFPVDTGRSKNYLSKKSILDKGKGKKSDSIGHYVSRIEGQTFCWSGYSKDIKFNPDNNPRLSANVYRPRNNEFVAKEKEMGYNHSWGTIALTPIMTKMSTHC